MCVLSTDNTAFLAELPNIAKGLVKPLPVNQKGRGFLNDLDSVKEHEPKWHQFGIITHTAQYVRAMTDVVPCYCRKWGVNTAALDTRIGARTKRELIVSASVFHDLGKFERGQKPTSVEPDYSRHEAKSETIIRERSVFTMLQQHHYSPEEIKYIARCAGLHYELGKLRGKAKDGDLKYTMAYANSLACKADCQQIRGENPEYKLEIGLMFLADALSKTDIIIIAASDLDIENQTRTIEGQLFARELSPELLGAVKQCPVNIAVVKTYLTGGLSCETPAG